MLIGAMGRWHGGVMPSNVSVRDLQNEARRHESQIIECTDKKKDLSIVIANHRAALRKIKQRARKLGVEL